MSFVPELKHVCDCLAEEIKGWAAALGIETEYSDPVLGEGGRYEWADSLRKSCDWAQRMAGSLLTAQGKADLAEDLKRRLEELYAFADGYEQRLDAMEGQRRVHVEEIVARYRQAFDDEDPDAARLWRLCQGIQRIWTFGFDSNELEMPENFAEAIDRALFEEDGAKRKAQAEMQRHAREFAEHLRVLASVEIEKPAVQQAAAVENKPETKKRGKRGPNRMPLKQAWRYLTVVQEWAGIQERNQKLPMRDRVQKVQVAEKLGITVRELDAMLGWYAKYRGQGRFPDDPRTLSRGELEKWFE
ncbi:MAG: hypothetical protein GXP25_00590 [Planctomycetes bacterium]|nr:hypothetical protein [Planctomycetota bacterium]